ncbi:MAG: methyltransferase domain-containing protein [Candidatus Liptonbacteria bacterium]|nr:methyltransferase domain-containing protein [Candidatus Liptonbacteria bacterium]
MPESHDELVRELIEHGYLKTPRVIQAFRAIDRKHFVPLEYRDGAYANEPIPIGHGQTISQPLTVAFMLEQLISQEGDAVLDIGAGSGWQTALLAHLVGDGGRVVAMERIPELAAMCRENVARFNFIRKGIVTILTADASRGAPPEYVRDGFNRIIAAAAADEMPAVWRTQLKVGGRIVAPVGQSVVVVEKKTANQFTSEEYFGFVFVPLVKG